MTQNVRWLAVLALLLAFGAGNVRAEEEEEVAPPARTTAAIPHTAPCCQACPSCANSAKCRIDETLANAMQYVVSAKIVHASLDGDCDEMMSPKVTVFAGQTANVSVRDLEKATGQPGGVGLMVQVTEQNKQIHLNLGVEESRACAYAPFGQLGSMTMQVQTASNVTIGKMKRIVFEKYANGSDASWAEVTVTAIPPDDDAEDSPLDCVVDVVEDLIDTVADVATSLFGDDAPSEPEYIQVPVAVAPREVQVPIMAPCPGVKQCVALESVMKPAVRIYFDKDKRTCVEMRDGNKYWKASAGQISVVAGELVLDGDVRCESTGASPEFTSNSIKVPLPAGVEVKVGD